MAKQQAAHSDTFSKQMRGFANVDESISSKMAASVNDTFEAFSSIQKKVSVSAPSAHKKSILPPQNQTVKLSDDLNNALMSDKFDPSKLTAAQKQEIDDALYFM